MLKSFFAGVVLTCCWSMQIGFAQEKSFVWPASSLIKQLHIQKSEFESLERMAVLERDQVLPAVKSMNGLIAQAQNEPWVRNTELAAKFEVLATRAEAIETAMTHPGLTRDHIRQSLAVVADFRTLLDSEGHQEKHNPYYVMYGLRFFKLKLTGLDETRETLAVDALYPAIELLNYFRQVENLDPKAAEVFATEIAEVKSIIASLETNTIAPGVFARLNFIADQLESQLTEAGARFNRWFPRDQFQLLATSLDRFNACFEGFRVRKNLFAPIYAQLHQVTLDLIADEFSNPKQEESLRELMAKYDRNVSDLPDFDTEDQQYVKEVGFYIYSIGQIMFKKPQ
jgi:hypothetical protein